MTEVPGAKLVGGVWLPAKEQHFVHMMTKNTKNHRIVDGKLTYQYRKLEAAMKHVPKDRRRVCVDIGSHVGLWAMWLVKEFQAVECFEPVELHASILPYNMPSDNYTLRKCALGEAPGRAEFAVEEDNTGHSHIIKTSSEGKGVEVRTLDSFEFECVDFIKIDVEGFELPVVRGAKETLRRCRPYMVLEQKGNDAGIYKQEKNAALKFCQSLGMVAKFEIGGDWFLAWS